MENGNNDSMNLSQDGLRSVILQRQREVSDLTEYRFKTLENLIKQRETDLSIEKQRYKNLKEDFEYNLTLLNGRDEELKRFETALNSSKKTIMERDQNISDLKSNISILESKIKQEESRTNELEIYYQEKLQDLRNESEAIKRAAVEEQRKISDDYESIIHELKKKLREKDEEFQSNKKEMQSAFRKEYDHLSYSAKQQLQMKDDQMKILKKELEEGYNQAILQTVESIRMEYTQKLDETRLDYSHKLDEAKKNLENSKQHQSELEDRIKQREHELHLLRVDYEEKIRVKEKIIEDHQSINFTQTLELQTFREKEENLKKIVEERRNDINNLRQQLKTSIEKENLLRRDMLKAQLQGEKDAEEIERKVSRQTDDIIRTLQQDREHLMITISEKESMIDSLRKENMDLAEKIRSGQHKKTFDDNLLDDLPPMPSPLHSIKASWSVDHSKDRFETNERISSLQNALQTAEKELTDKSRRISELESELHNASRGSIDQSVVKQLNETINILKQQATPSTEQLTGYNSIITDLRIELEKAKDKLVFTEEKYQAALKENKLLKTKLKDAAKDLKALFKERESLMDINNKLKSELDKYKDVAPSKPSSNESENYEIKRLKTEVNMVQNSLKEQITTNNALRRELHRWTGQVFEQETHNDEKLRPIEEISPQVQAKSRQKLEGIRESLSLLGKQSVIEERVKETISDRETESQRKALKRLKQKV